MGYARMLHGTAGYRERDREGETETENHEPRTLKRGKEGRILPFSSFLKG